MNNMSNFSETLTELMIERNLTTDALGKIIGTSGSTVRTWKRGDYKLRLANALKLADYFNCSLEFLMGRTDTRLNYTPRVCPRFHDRLMQIMVKKGKSRYQVVKKDKILSNSHFSQWKKGVNPLIETIMPLTKYFDCTLDYLVGRDN